MRSFVRMSLVSKQLEQFKRATFRPQKFETYPDWGANQSPSLSIYLLHNTPVGRACLNGGLKDLLPKFAQISYSMDTGVPPVFPQ